MLRITAKINIGENGGELNTVTSSQSGINVSSTLNEVIGHHEQIQHPFILGRSRLGGGDCFTKKANFYIGRIASDNNGNFASNYVINVSGSNMTLLTIVFNKRDNEFPRFIMVDGESVYDDDVTWSIKLDGGDTHTITISNWNTPNSPLVISSIYTDLSIDLDETNLLDFERTIMDRSDVSKPSFGIISNTGSLSFIDKDGEVADYIVQQLISSQNVISAYLENTETGAKEQIACFNMQQWSYKDSQSLANVQLKDDLEEWQETGLIKMPLQDAMSALEIYNYLKDKTSSKFVFEPLDGKTQELLINTTIPYPYLDEGSLWQQWDKLCQLCALHIYKNNGGNIVVIYNDGN